MTPQLDGMTVLGAILTMLFMLAGGIAVIGIWVWYRVHDRDR
jgi:hypothetical protein